MIESRPDSLRPHPQHERSTDSPHPQTRRKRTRRSWRLEAILNEVSLDAARFRWLLIVFGAVALAWIVVVGALVLRHPAAPPEAVAALPPLAGAAAPPPLAEVVASSPFGQVAIGLGETHEPEPGPINSEVSQEANLEPARPAVSTGDWARDKAPSASGAPALGNAPLPPMRPAELGPVSRPMAGWDGRPMAGWDGSTALYDISAHTVYLPDGTKLEAHSGLGDRLDDPRFVSERDRGPTPPGVYELTLRESLFHGVQALRLTPSGQGDVFGRSGLLAHPYMLGPSGDSNGCVSFKNYDAFLRAYQNGQVKRLAVVAERAMEVAQRGRP